MAVSYVSDPVAVVEAAGQLQASLRSLGFHLALSHDAHLLNQTRLALRDSTITPLFHPEVNNFNGTNFFWMKLTTSTNEVIAFQAYRLDKVHPNIADWVLNLVIGTYMRRNMLMVPAFAAYPESSIAHKIKGDLVYHGECWVSPRVKNRRVIEDFARLGMILSLVKWQPDYIWALSDKNMATRGHPGRMGYTSFEGAFLRWTWAPEDNGNVEWLHYIDGHALMQLALEVVTGSDQQA